MTTARTSLPTEFQPHGESSKKAARVRPGDWIVACHNGAQATCLRCKETLTLELPLRVEIWCAAMRAFVKVHKRCPERSL